MVEKKLKAQINELRNSIFNEKKEEVETNKEGLKKNNLEAANVNLQADPGKQPTGIFRDVRSMDKRLEKLEDSFYSYAYDSTKVLTSFHKNMKKLEYILNDLSKKSNISSNTIDRIESLIPHTCPLVPKEDGNTIIKKKKGIIKGILIFILALITLTIAVFFSNLAYEIIYINLKSIVGQSTT